ncbi:MAG TPA: molybdopterin-binding protein [Syntrophorhabdales bacterium]|nr:molybdopterin-binding protein [Syntrophorhabdales bacterium]
MKLSARNMLKGKVKSLNIGPVNAEVIIEVPGGAQIVAMITKTSAEALGLAAGKDAYAIFKASAVLVAVD